MCRGHGLDLTDMTIKHCDKLVSVEISRKKFYPFSVGEMLKLFMTLSQGMFSNSIIDILTEQ